MQTGGSTTHELKNGRAGGEPVFVPAAGAIAEDDGYLLTYVYDPADNLSELIIMEASNMEQEPVARIHLPTRVPAGFHGSWIADPD
jgi:carotenoid cleavage dioxygenase